MTGTRWLTSAALCALVLGVVVAQDVPPPDKPDKPDKPKKKESSLQPRPDDDPKTVLWVSKLGAARPHALSTEAGVLLHYVMSPEGDRFYYFRKIDKNDDKKDENDKKDQPKAARYALYSVGPDQAEEKVADTGADATPPLFLGDGRILFTTRRFDMNADNKVDVLDDSALMVSNRDGGNLRQVATLKPGEVPLAVWRDDREVLLSVPAEEGANGWIVSMDLVRGEREKITTGFNVELVLDKGRLLIERQKATENNNPQRQRWDRWGRPIIPSNDSDEAKPVPTLLDPSEHLIYDPKDKSVTSLYSPSRRARIVVSAEGSYFGQQEPDQGDNQRSWAPRPVPVGNTEIVIIDDAQHHDTRVPSPRYNYQVIGWIRDRGLLAIEQGNLGSHLLLIDHALTPHTLADFDFSARSFVASADGLTVSWLDVEDTDKNGFLQPWRDNSRIKYIHIE